MRRDLPQLKSSFLSCEKDTETIIRKLFVESGSYSDELKRLLIVNTKDCLDKSNENYDKIVKNTTVKELIKEKYLTIVPRITKKEQEEVKSHIILTFNDFSQTSNPEFRDCMVSFDILCPLEHWELGDYQLRPLKIAGIIDGLLNNQKFSGIGRLQFFSCGQLPVDNDIAGYTLLYQAMHGSDDFISNL